MPMVNGEEYFSLNTEDERWLEWYIDKHPTLELSLISMAIKIRELWHFGERARLRLSRSLDPETPNYLVVLVPGGHETEDVGRLWTLRRWRAEQDPSVGVGQGILVQLDYAD